MLNRKLAVGSLILIPSLVIICLPIYSVVNGYFNPSIQHIERARHYLPNSTLLQVGSGSGSYSCINGECDYSNTYDQRQYISISGINKIVTIRKAYQSEWIEFSEEITLKLGFALATIYILAIAGFYLSIKELRRV